MERWRDHMTAEQAIANTLADWNRSYREDALCSEIERLRTALQHAENALYNGFKPDNQSRGLHVGDRPLVASDQSATADPIKCEGCGTEFEHRISGSIVTEDECNLCPACAADYREDATNA